MRKQRDGKRFRPHQPRQRTTLASKTGTYAIRGGKVVRIDVLRGAFNASESPDFSKGPIEMFTEFRKGETPVEWKRHSKNRFPAVASMQELREYKAKNVHAGIPLEWTR